MLQLCDGKDNETRTSMQMMVLYKASMARSKAVKRRRRQS